MPIEAYRVVHRSMPIPRVDLAIVRDDPPGVLVGRRLEEPAKGELWFPGGRILRGENFFTASKRIAKREFGIDIEPMTVLGFEELFFDTDPVGHGRGTHAVVAVVACCVKGGTGSLRVDASHSGHRWVTGVGDEPELGAYVARFTRSALSPGGAGGGPT